MEIVLKGKRALVTGAGRGIGRDLVKKLVLCGADVVGMSKTLANLESLKKELPQVQTIQVDIGDWNATKKAVESLGPIDLLVNNAAYAQLTAVGEVTEEICNSFFDVNVKAVINITQVVAAGMKERGTGGSIVNISSIAGMKALNEHLVYGATKAAMDMMTKIMALDLGQYKIRVNSVNPTVTMTDMAKVGWGDPVKAANMLAKIPIGRFAETEDVVDVIVFLLSDKSAMVTGSIIPVDGGFTA